MFPGVQHGLSLLSRNHYTWTYAPTAVMVVLVSVWRQIDFQTKLPTPWQELKNGGAKASNSVLLDYLSPFLVVGALESIKARHFGVSSTIGGFGILKLITLLSTGLFQLTTVGVTRYEIPVFVTSSFDSTLFNGSDYAFGKNVSLLYTAYGNTARGLDYADGTKSFAAFQTFQPADGQINGTITAEVDGFFPQVDCEEAVFDGIQYPAFGADNRNFTNFRDASFQVYLSTSTCKPRWEPGFGLSLYAKDPSAVWCPPHQLAGSLYIVDCTGKDNTTASTDNGYIFALTNIFYNQTGVNVSDQVPSRDLSNNRPVSWSRDIAQH